MNLLKLLPPILSLIILAAHFSRSDLSELMLMCIVMPFLLFIKNAWVVRLIQIILVLGAIEWIRALYNYTSERIAYGESWTRLAIIIGIVALFTALSALVFRFGSLKSRYNLK